MRIRNSVRSLLLLGFALGIAPTFSSSAQDATAPSNETQNAASTASDPAPNTSPLAAPPTVKVESDARDAIRDDAPILDTTTADPPTASANATSTLEPTSVDTSTPEATESTTPTSATTAPENTQPAPPEDAATSQAMESMRSELRADKDVESEAPPAEDAPLSLSLADAIAMGIQNNLRLEIERHGPLMADEEWKSLEGAYDPEFFIDGGYQDIDKPTASALDGTSDPGNAVVEIQQWDGTGGLRGLIPGLGAQYKLAYEAARTETNSRISRLSPQYRTGLYGELTIPLLRNLIWNKPWTAVRMARAAYQAENERFRGTLMDTVLEIEKAYWNLIATAEKKHVAEKSLETARALLHQSEIQYEVGVISRVEVTEAKAGVAEREVNLIRAKNTYRSAQDQLLHLTMAQELRTNPARTIAPTDALDQYTPYTLDLEVAIQKANENRPQLAESQYEIRRLEFLLKHAKNQRLPQLDVSGRYGYEGLSGKANPNIPPTIPPAPPLVVPESYADSHDDFFRRDGNRQWATRGTFSIPLGNRTASHQVSKTEYELHKAKTQQRYLEQQIVLEVRDATRNLQSALEGIEAAERRRQAAEEQLRAERLRLENGESTPFDVLQRERDLVAAESEKIAALQLYRNSDASLDYAQGTILKNRNIHLEEAGALH